MRNLALLLSARKFHTRFLAGISISLRSTAKGPALNPDPLFSSLQITDLDAKLPPGCRNWLFHTRLPQKLSRFLWRRRINVKPRAPLESGGLGEFRHEFHVPVIVIVIRILRRRGVNHQIVGRIIEHSIGLNQQCLQRLGQVLEHVRGRVLERRFVPLGRNPGLEGAARRAGRDGQEVLVLSYHAAPGFYFLLDNVAEYAALLV